MQLNCKKTSAIALYVALAANAFAMLNDDEALAAARASYSPYTGTKSGAALLCESGKIFCGSLLESAAYNPSLSALQSAFTLRALGGASGDPVRRCVLAETGPAAMGEVFLPLMRSLAPGADCELFDIDD